MCSALDEASGELAAHRIFLSLFLVTEKRPPGDNNYVEMKLLPYS